MNSYLQSPIVQQIISSSIPSNSFFIEERDYSKLYGPTQMVNIINTTIPTTKKKEEKAVENVVENVEEKVNEKVNENVVENVVENVEEKVNENAED